MFRTAALMALLSSVFSGVVTADSLRADSPVGRALLNSATVLEQPSRRLEQGQQYYYNQGQNQNGERDASFLASYYIKYLGCSSTVTYDQEGNGGDGNPLITSNLVKFSLCPNSCSSSCDGGGLYVVGMEEFIMAYNEMKMDEQEWRCEMQRESCEYNQNCQYDDQYCEQLCFKEAGMEECIEYEGQEEFELDRYLECGQVEFNENQNNNGNNNNQNQNNNNNQNYNDAAYWYEYFMGPYCASDGKSILMRLYYDDGCTAVAKDNGVFYKRTGMEMPYESSSIIPHGECFSCEDQEQAREQQQQQQQNQYNGNNNNNNQNNGNWYYDKEPSQLCQESYERAARCETGMDVYYPDETGCTFINTYLPKLEGASKSVFKSDGASSSKTAVIFAWLFGLSTVLFGAYAYFLYRKIKRGAVNLSSQDGALA